MTNRQTRNSFFICLAIVCFVPVSWGAIPNRSSGVTQEILPILQTKLPDAVAKIYRQGPKGYKALRRITFQESYPMGVRWKAFMVMTRIGGKKSLPEIRQALKSSDWFLRSAGLLALEKISAKKAVRKARSLFAEDKALMVRAKSLEVLRNAPSKKVRQLLWSKLNAKENFYRGQGLWIRKHIVQYLADYGRSSDLKGFREIFNSKKVEDQELKKIAFPALERLLRKKAPKNLSVQGQVSFWHGALRAKTL